MLTARGHRHAFGTRFGLVQPDERVSGQTTGAGIHQLVLNGATPTTTLSITTSGGTIPGTTLDSLTIVHAAGAAGALSQFSAGGVSLTPNGTISADANVTSMTVGSMGVGSGLYVSGSLNTLTAAAVAAGFELDVSGNIGTFTATSIGAGSEIYAGGSMGQVKTTAGGLSGSLTAGLGIGTVSVNGGNLQGTILANGTAGIGTVSVRRAG